MNGRATQMPCQLHRDARRRCHIFIRLNSLAAGESFKWAVAIPILKLRVLRRFPPAHGIAQRQQLSVFDVQRGNLRGPLGRVDGDLLDGPERLIVLGVERRAAEVAPARDSHIGGELKAGAPTLEKHRVSEDRFPAGGLADHRVAACELTWAGADGVESNHDVAVVVSRYRGIHEALRSISDVSFIDDGGVRRIDTKPMDGPTPGPGIDGVRRHPDLAIHHDRRRLGDRVVIVERQRLWVWLWRIEEIVVVAPTKEIFIRIAAAEIETWLKDVAVDIIALVCAKGVLNDALRRQDDLVLLAAVEIDGRHDPLSRGGNGNVPKDGHAIDPRLGGQQVSLGQYDEGKACRNEIDVQVSRCNEQARAIVADHGQVTVRITVRIAEVNFEADEAFGRIVSTGDGDSQVGPLNDRGGAGELVDSRCIPSTLGGIEDDVGIDWRVVDPERDAGLTPKFSPGHLHNRDTLLRIYGVMVVDQFDEVIRANRSVRIRPVAIRAAGRRWPPITPAVAGGAAKVMPDGRPRFGHGIAAARERRSSQARCDTTDPYVWRLSAVCRSRDCSECSGEKQGNTFGRLHGKLLRLQEV